MYYKKDGETFYPEYYFQVKNQKAKSIFFYNMWVSKTKKAAFGDHKISYLFLFKVFYGC